VENLQSPFVKRSAREVQPTRLSPKARHFIEKGRFPNDAIREKIAGTDAMIWEPNGRNTDADRTTER
jgi:hypothetical protein